MAMESFARPYPVIFNDGERDHDKGQIGVHSVLTFKRFQVLLSQKVGLPAAQLSTVFVCRRTAKDADKRQKLPINENTNFNIILNQHNPLWEKDCHFLVSLKKSKKERKGTRRRTTEVENGEEDCSLSPRNDASPKEERPKFEVLSDTGLACESITLVPQALIQPSLLSNNADLESEKLSPSQSNGKANSEKIILRRDQTMPFSSTLRSASQTNVSTTTIMQTLPSPHAIGDNGDKTRNHNESIDARLMMRSEQQSMFGCLPHQQAVVSRAVEEIQERKMHDSVVRPTVLLQRSVLHLPGTLSSSPLLSPPPSVRPVSAYHHSINAVLPRVANGMTMALQQAQAQYLNLQACTNQMHLDPQALSRMRGVVRDLAAYENAGHRVSGECTHCCTFREMNIKPTPFHLCVHDRVTNGFGGPSPAGPIGRPTKRVEAAA